jgi:hypothetical protein
MTSMRTLTVFWISGLIAGIVLMERWRRHGGRYVPVEDIPEGSVVASNEADSAASTARPNFVELVITGARLDAERIRRRATVVPLGVPLSRRRRLDLL